jgi:hypothetical protein
MWHMKYQEWGMLQSTIIMTETRIEYVRFSRYTVGTYSIRSTDTDTLPNEREAA